MPIRNWTQILASLAVIALAQSANCQTISLLCEFPFVEASATSVDEATKVREIATRSNARFEELGLKLTKKVRIEITENLDVSPGHCVALHDEDESKIQVLPTHCLGRNPGRLGPFPKLSAPVLFESLVVHELTLSDVRACRRELRF